MKKIPYCLVLLIFFFACQKEESTLSKPSSITDLKVEPRAGGVLISWDLPADSNFLYLEIRYEKHGEIVKTNVSKYTDSVLIEGLLNKLEYTFEVQAFNRNEDETIGGETLTTSSVKPIRRPVMITYDPTDLTKIEGITPAMLETYTQEVTAGPKKNLIDGSSDTFWHSAWSSNIAPLPHWIRINFNEPVSIGAMKYSFRKNNDSAGRPNQFAVETSEDGVTWVRQWTSEPNLPVEPRDEERSLDFDKNFTARFFRIMILANPGNKTYVHMSELSLYKMKESLTDLELEAEANY